MRRQTFEYGAETQARPADEQQRCHLMLDCAAISLRRRLLGKQIWLLSQFVSTNCVVERIWDERSAARYWLNRDAYRLE